MSHTCLCQSVNLNDVDSLRAAEQELRMQGIDCELLENVAPRMYFTDQLQRDLGRKDEICDFVLRLNSLDYDVGFIRQEDGSYLPVFDDLGDSIQKTIGTPFDSKKPILDLDGEPYPKEAYAIARFVAEYTKALSIKVAVASGLQVEGWDVDDQGQIQIMVAVED